MEADGEPEFDPASGFQMRHIAVRGAGLPCDAGALSLLGLLGVTLLSQRFSPCYPGERGANRVGSGSRFLLRSLRFRFSWRFRAIFGAGHHWEHLRCYRRPMFHGLYSHGSGAVIVWRLFGHGN